MKKILLLCFAVVLSIPVAWAQERVVSGKVTSEEDGSSLPGVNVLVKGTTTGTITDFDGNYKITVPDDAELLFSFIGFLTEEVQVSGRSVIDVALTTDITQLSEVVVTAAGIEANKRELGYSIQNVDAEDVRKSGENNFVAALSGKVAGVQVTSSGGAPGSAAQIRIRGNKSVQGSNGPLFVVDGIPIDNSTFNTFDSPEDDVSNLGSGGVTNSNRAIDINPEDVASLTVLKGPAATVLYGIRAANGAVVITTKKGSRNSAAKVKYSFGYTIDKVNKLPDLQTEYAQGSVQGGVPTFQAAMTGSTQSQSWGPLISSLRYANEPSVWDPNGLIVPAGDPRATSRVAQSYNNAEDFFENGSNMTHDLSVSGGTEKTSYFFSVGRLDQTGIMPNSEFARTSFRATTSAELFKNFTATLSANYIQSGGQRVQNGSNTSGVMLGLLRTSPSFDNSAGYLFEDGSQRAYRGGSIYDNPYFTVNKNFTTDEVNRVIGYTQLSYDAAPWLNVTYRLGIDTYGDDRIFRNDVNSSSVPVGQVINMTIRSKDINSDFLVTFKKQFSEKFDFNATVGHNYYNKDIHINRIDGQGLASPGFFNIASATSVNVSEGVTRRELYGLFGTVTLNYNNQFFLNLSGRNDWSSTLPEENNSFFYPAASFGWDFTQTFGINSTFFSYGKLRASWGQVGNDAPFAVTNNGFVQSRVRDGWTTPQGVIFPALGLNAFNPNSLLGNSELKAETTTTIEFGTDLQFLDGKIGLDLTYFNATTTDAILNITIPSASGWQQRAVNSAELTNKGIEAALTASIIDNDAFTYDVGINFTRIRNKVEKLAEGIPFITIDPFGTQRIAEGEPFGIFFGSRFLRDENGQMVINPDDGMPFEDPTQGIVGDPNPDFLIGFRNTFTYKGLTLSFLLDIREGGDVYNGTKGVLNNFGVGEETLDRNERVIFPGVLGEVGSDGSITPTSTPNNIEVVKGGTDGGTNYYQNYGFVNLTELTIEDGSWIRMRDISLSYNLPSSTLSKLPFSAVSIGFTARNLFLITDYTGIDPETNLTGDSSNVIGYDYFNNPNTKSYGVNVNLTF
ncbi:SusC/RagA family TonB-linked outer membrane protein [Fulvivirga kasyanovii]|uniref:SusC/RagA family TonB-linked outer membrane protein n=1 Tax=Fulvivirga kasyanovii TaxID=396812 RepID=A0ABW9RM53_9BACT|nr:SusC/RagA family TonB-linked outer membrane protein [Fulvivirga kasyanovii]MTI25066.1 SusC/RagA family TonB-linked outer membrane protein [Fulvivirga kasyanovii]